MYCLKIDFWICFVTMILVFGMCTVVFDNHRTVFRLLLIYHALKTRRSQLPTFTSDQLLSMMDGNVIEDVLPKLTTVPEAQKVTELYRKWKRRKGQSESQKLEVFDACLDNEAVVGDE